MKSFMAAMLLMFSLSVADPEETSMMQSLSARHTALTTSTKTSRKDATTTLMETATKMLKNGATPDVITFIETTIAEVNQNVLGQIVDEHHRDQALIDSLLARFEAAVTAMEAACAAIREKEMQRASDMDDHKECRSLEALHCGRSRRCEEELEHLWSIVRLEEEEMRRIHWAIHGEWCLGNAPDHPSLANPFHWTITEYKEGAETSESVNNYPAVDLEDDVFEFRRFSVEYFGLYIVQKPKVEEAWFRYNQKLQECRDLEVLLDDQVERCDELQVVSHDKTCQIAADHRQFMATFGHEYHMTMVAYEEAVTAIQQLEYDRKREWETLHITTCLLETVYTHVIHSIDSGEPCPTTESHPNQTETEINYCHVVEESMTANLTIDYGNPPPKPTCDIETPVPCSAEYIWDDHGSFPMSIQTSHIAALTADAGLANYFTTLSQHGWAGCAAPRVCISCEMPDLVIDIDYVANEVCQAQHDYLMPGQLDLDTFKCQTGNQCIMSSGRCNGEDNCDDGSDEIGCYNSWGRPAVLENQECQDPFISDVQFRCADNTCAHIEGRCNGVNNCADGSDEQGCMSGIVGLTIEPSTGLPASIEVPSIQSQVFTDRTYTFDSLGSFTGHSYIKMANDDKYIKHSHVQMKLRLPHPLTVYVVKLDAHELPWLLTDGWSVAELLEGVSYHGTRATRHTAWSGDLVEDYFPAGQVWEKTFPAGTVEMRGNNAGDGSYLIFVANPASPPRPTTTTTTAPPVVCCQALTATCLACSASMTVEDYCEMSPGTEGCSLLNQGQQCWHSDQCAGQGGYCPNFCGTGVCCRLGHTYSERERDECGPGGTGISTMHTCQPPPQFVTAAPGSVLLHENEQCWHSNQCGGQGGFCPNFCGSGVCCRLGHVYSEREGQECGAGGLGLAHMHSCQNPPQIVTTVAPTVAPPAPTHYLTVVSWPAHAWGQWNDDAKGAIEKCSARESTADENGNGFLFTSCCTAEGGGMRRACGSTRNTNFETAVEQCAAQGGRLCTADEAVSLDENNHGRRATAGQGCSVDGPMTASGGDLNRLWTSTPCSP